MADFKYKHNQILAHRADNILQRKCLVCEYQEQIDESDLRARLKKFRLFSTVKHFDPISMSEHRDLVEICDNCGNLSTYKVTDEPIFPIE